MCVEGRTVHGIYACLDGGFGYGGGGQSLLEYSSKRTPQEMHMTGSIVWVWIAERMLTSFEVFATFLYLWIVGGECVF